MYFCCSIGKTFSANAAQCGQVSEEYSTIVMGAVAEPSTMSGRATGFATNAAVSFSAAAAGEKPRVGGAPSEPDAIKTSAASTARRKIDNGTSLQFEPSHAWARARA